MKQYFVKFTFSYLHDSNSGINDTIIFTVNGNGFFMLSDVFEDVRFQMRQKHKAIIEIGSRAAVNIYNVKIIDILPL